MERIFTKKKERLLTALLSLFCICAHLDVNAQEWTGVAPENGKTVLLYNVGTGWYINGSNLWGTQLSLLHNGQFYTIESGYKFKNGDKYLGFGQGGDDTRVLFNDNGSATFTFTKVSTTEFKYNISTKLNNRTQYLVAGDNNAAIDLKTSIEADDLNAQWMFITKDELEKRFKDVSTGTELGAASAEGTYLIPDANFARGYAPDNSWQVTESDYLNSYKVATSDGTHTKRKPTGEIGTAEHDTNGFKGTIKSGTEKVSYYVGMGYDSECKYQKQTLSDGTSYNEFFDEDVALLNQFSNSTKPNEAHINRYLGGLYTANIHGAGKVYMNTIIAPVDGWYRISCNGFTTKTAKLYATTTNNQKDETKFRTKDESQLNTPAEIPATYALAAIELQSGNYAQGVMVYAAAGAKIEFGIEETSELGEDETSEKVWACFDDFALYYLGVEKEPYFYFNENEENMDPLKEQVCTNGTHGLYLQRKLTSGQWNSIILPVNLTGRQLQSAFGEGVKLSELRGIVTGDKYLIKFESVNLANNGIAAGKHYIIKPSSDKEKKTSGKYEFKRVKGDEETPAMLPNEIVEPTEASPVYYIPSVTFSSIAETDKGVIVSENVPGNDETGPLVFKGTFTNQTENIIPAGSFILASNGDWYHTQTKAYSVKGFRTWIETSQVPVNAEIAFEINGIQEYGGIVTSIEGLEIQPQTKCWKNVYDINGRIVRSNGITEGLDKGIYIVNGKKVVVK